MQMMYNKPLGHLENGNDYINDHNSLIRAQELKFP